MLFTEKNFNIMGYCIALTIIGSIIFILTLFHFFYFCSICFYTIFKKEKQAQPTLFIDALILMLELIISSVLSFVCSVNNQYWPFTLIWWLFSLFSILLIALRIIFISKNNKSIYSFESITQLDVNQLRIKFNITDWKISDHVLNQNRKWDKSLSDEYLTLLNQIDALTRQTNNKTRIDLISQIILFNENYSTVFCIKKRKYAMLLFIVLVENLQKKLLILK